MLRTAVEFVRALFAPLPPENSPFDYHTEVGMMFYSALLGAIVGATVGGAIQAILSRIEFRRQDKREK